MSLLSEEQRTLLFNATRDEAIALIEDMKHIREVISVFPPTADKLRRISPILRRLLIELRLQVVAGPRIGRIKILAPDSRSQQPSIRRVNPLYHQEIGFHHPSFPMQGMTLNYGGNDEVLKDETKKRRAPEKHDMSIAAFLGQPVIYFDKEWFSRKQILSFCANIGGGVHFGNPRLKDQIAFKHIEELRVRVVWRDLTPGMARISVDVDNSGKCLAYSPTAHDPVSLELFSTCYLLANTPAMLILERSIREEVMGSLKER